MSFLGLGLPFLLRLLSRNNRENIPFFQREILSPETQK